MYSMSLTVMEEIPETNNNDNIQKFVSSSLLTSDSPTSIAVHSSSSSSASSSCEVSLLNTSDSSLVQMESDLSGKAPDSSTTKLEFTGTTIIPDLTTPSIVTPTSAVPTMIPENVPQHYTVEYLAELVNERKQTSAFSGVFNHTGRLIDEEINRVRLALFQFEFTKEHVVLPAPVGEIVTVTEKVFVPAKSHPEYNFVGRILGPRGMTAKQLEQETSCKVMIRGKGSMRDKKKEDMNRGKPNWEHLSEELHVLIQCEDTKNRCEVKIQRAIEEVRKLLVPAPEGEDELKKKQLMELAIINGTYRTGALQAGIGALGQQALSGGGYGAAAVKSNNNGARMTPTLGNIAPQIRSPTLMQNQLLMQQSAAAQRSTPSAAALAQAHFQAAAMSLANQTGQQQANSMLQAQAQAHLQQSSQGAAEYQMLLNQLQYDPFTNAVALQQQQQQQYAALMLSGANQALLGEYANYEMQGAILPSVQHRNTLHNNPSASSTTSSVRAEAHPYHRHGAGKQ